MNTIWPTPLQRERWWPWCCGICVVWTLALAEHDGWLNMPDHVVRALAAISYVSGIGITWVSVRLALRELATDDDVTRRLRDSGYGEDYAIYLIEPWIGGGALALLAWVTWIAPSVAPLQWLLVGVMTFVGCCLWRVLPIASALARMRHNLTRT